MSRSAFELDISVVIATVALAIVGVLFVYSSGITSNGQVTSNEYVRQIIWVVTGVILMLAVTFIDYRSVEKVALWIYLGAIGLLLVTFVFGRVVNGAKSWLGFGVLGVQPSEFAKLATIVMVARYYRTGDHSRRGLSGFVGALGITAIPMLLILAQPDLGTALVYLPILLFIAFVAGAALRHILYVLLFGAAVVVSMVLPVWQTALHEGTIPWISVLTDIGNMRLLLIGLAAAILIAVTGFLFTRKSVFYWFGYGISLVALALPTGFIARRVLHDYQIMRLIVFLDPYVDPRGAGWNIIQSVTAVGSGGPFGKGYLKGTQSHYQYLPQQSTDFIFSILAEEWGFIGAFLVFALFGILLVRGLIIMHSARDPFAAYISAGIVGMLFFHVIVNIGMAIGIMPITGIPLMLLSYGGSSLWTAMLSIGLLLSVYQHRYQY